jgi:predicted extracellular nuclease
MTMNHRGTDVSRLTAFHSGNFPSQHEGHFHWCYPDRSYPKGRTSIETGCVYRPKVCTPQPIRQMGAEAEMPVNFLKSGDKSTTQPIRH